MNLQMLLLSLKCYKSHEKNLQIGCPISSHREYNDQVSTSFLLKGKNVNQIISIIRAPVDLHYKEQRVQCSYSEFHQHGGWSLSSTGRLTLP